MPHADSRQTVQMSATSDGCEADPPRHELLAKALALSYISVFWGAAAGAWAVVASLLAGSLGVLGLGLNVLADVAGSIGLVWRFGIEQRDPVRGHRAEARASMVVAGALSVVAVALTVAAVNDLASLTVPGHSVMAMIAAGTSVLVLAPLGVSKHRTGSALHSHALKGDGTLSAIGAVLGVLALVGLLADTIFGWWADRCAALAVAAVAGVEAVRVIRMRPDPTPT
jgi:divalent metal cation (Fe/Co/Zn/Cd) transporter